MVGVTQNPNFTPLLCQIPLKLAIGIFADNELKCFFECSNPTFSCTLLSDMK